MSRFLVMLVAAGVVLGACGGGSGAPGAGSSSGSSTTAAPAQDVAADHAHAAAAVLRLSDLPPGWTSAPHTNSPDVPGLDKQIADCLGVSLSLLNQKDPTNADSPDFSNSNGGQISNNVGYEPTSAKARQAMSIFQSPKMPRCLNSAIQSYLAYALKHPTSPSDSIPSGITFGQPTTAPLAFSTAGDATAAYRLTMPVHASGLDVNVYADFVIAIKGRAGAVVTTEEPGSAPDVALEQRLLADVVGRLVATQ